MRFECRNLKQELVQSRSVLILKIFAISVAYALSNAKLPLLESGHNKPHSNSRGLELQIAVESFATDSGGSYPTTLKQLAPYLPGGEIKTEKPGSCEGIYFSDALSCSEKIQSMRTRDAQTISIPGAKPGQIVYSSADAGNSYAIVKVNDDGTLLSGVGGHVLMMSNQ